MNEFQEFAKIARYSREVIVTEKIDGTNASIYIGEVDEPDVFLTGSRTKWITPEDDNHGFSRWAHSHREELVQGLGPGRHFGEWWGSGIQRGYGLKNGEKRFSLFNTSRWVMYDSVPGEKQEVLPVCCSLVPILWRGNMDDFSAEVLLNVLKWNGSQVQRGFMNPEGIVLYHVAGNFFMKKTIEKDEGKGT